MNATSFETILSEEYSSVCHDPMAAQMHSIRNHIEYLLNTRQGSISHVPDLGLPELSSIYQGLPDSAYELMQQIKTCIEKYEPRLTQVRVHQQETNANEQVINLLIEARIVGQQQAKFITFFASDGHAQVDCKN